MINSPNLTTVPLPPANGRSIGDDSRRPASRGMLREPGHRIKTGENSRPTKGEYSTPAHTYGDGRADVRRSDGVAAAVAEPPPTALTAVRHAEDREAALRCRQANAAGPLGLTFEQCDMKSLRQAERIAFSCALVGC